MTSQLFFVALPLLLIFGATFITMVCQWTDKGMSRFQKFFVLTAAYSMVVFVVGFLAPSVLALFVPRNYPAIPGSASEYADLTPEDIERIGNYPVADPEGPLVRWLEENDRVVYRPDVLRHFAMGGEYGLVDHREAFRTFARPLLVVSGVHDRTTPAESAQELVDGIPTAEHVIIDGAAHMIPYEQPEAFHAALRSFLSRI